jgi:hypothetical protein
VSRHGYRLKDAAIWQRLEIQSDEDVDGGLLGCAAVWLVGVPTFPRNILPPSSTLKMKAVRSSTALQPRRPLSTTTDRLHQCTFRVRVAVGVVRTHVWYSRGTGFSSTVQRPAVLTILMWFSSVPPRKFLVSTLKYATATSFQILHNLSFAITFPFEDIVWSMRPRKWR